MACCLISHKKEFNSFMMGNKPQPNSDGLMSFKKCSTGFSVVGVKRNADT